MTVDECESCSDLGVVVEIRSPDELSKAIRAIRSRLTDRSVEEITQRAHSPSGEFLDLSEAGPWPDYIEHYFRCMRCNRRFRFAVDTYHGGGGDWDGGIECY